MAERNDNLHLPTWSASLLNYLSWKEQSQSSELITGSALTPSIFPPLGIQPVRGRVFQEGEDRPGSPAVAMIRENLWKRRFAADPTLIGLLL